MYTIAIDARKALDFGIGTYIRMLIKHLALLDKSNRYYLITDSSQDNKIFGDLPENFILHPVNVKPYSFKELTLFSVTLKQLGADLYHATHYSTPLFIFTKFVVTIHDIIHLLFPHFLPSQVAYYYARFIIQRNITRSDRVIAVSATTKQDLITHMNCNQDKIRVIYNGVEDIFFKEYSTEESHRWLETLGIKRPYILFVGNAKPHKNVDMILRAYAQALSIMNFEESMVLVGGFEQSLPRIKALSKALGIEERINVVGYVASEALPHIYRKATLLFYPSLYEGFGLPLLEAMACGTPVITSNLSALRELGEGVAKLVNPLDISEMARALVELLGNLNLRVQMSKEGKERALEFKWEKVASKTLNLYKEVLNE